MIAITHEERVRKFWNSWYSLVFNIFYTHQYLSIHVIFQINVLFSLWDLENALSDKMNGFLLC